MSLNEIDNGWNGRTIPRVATDLLLVVLWSLPFRWNDDTVCSLGICCICNSPPRESELFLVTERRGWDLLLDRFGDFRSTSAPSRFACFSASSSSDKTACGFPTADESHTNPQKNLYQQAACRLTHMLMQFVIFPHIYLLFFLYICIPLTVAYFHGLIFRT
jgi:hypothetical protein